MNERECYKRTQLFVLKTRVGQGRKQFRRIISPYSENCKNQKILRHCAYNLCDLEDPYHTLATSFLKFNRLTIQNSYMTFADLICIRKYYRISNLITLLKKIGSMHQSHVGRYIEVAYFMI
jgi:hypothetical protein